MGVSETRGTLLGWVFSFATTNSTKQKSIFVGVYKGILLCGGLYEGSPIFVNPLMWTLLSQHEDVMGAGTVAGISPWPKTLHTQSLNPNTPQTRKRSCGLVGLYIYIYIHIGGGVTKLGGAFFGALKRVCGSSQQLVSRGDYAALLQPRSKGF